MNTPFNTRQSYSIVAKPRPVRIAFLVDPENTTDKLLNSIIQFNLVKWGGRYNPIVPCNGKEITDSFWDLLIFSDPDIVYSFVEITDELIEKIDKEISPYYFSSSPKETEDKLVFIPQLENPLTSEFLIKDIPKLGLCPAYVSKCPLAVFRMDERSDDFTFILRNFGYLKYLLKFFSKQTDKELRIEREDIYEDIDALDIDGREDLNTILGKLHMEPYVIYPMLISESPGSYFPSEPRERDHGFLLAIGDGIRNFLYSWNRIYISEGHLRKTLSEMVIPESLLNDSDILESIKNLITDYIYRVSSASNSQGELILVSCDKKRSELNDIAEFFRRDNYWRIDIRCTSEDFRFPHINDETVTPLGFERSGDIYQFSDPKALIPNKGPVPPGGVSELFSENWIMDINISYRPERFFYTNVGYWWKLTRRSGISYLFTKRLSRINKKGSISFQVKSSEKNIDIDIPDEMSVFHQLISPFYNYMYNADIRKKKPIYYKDIRYSEKGRYLGGVLGLFPSLWHAKHCFSERFWRRIFRYMCNVEDRKEAKRLSNIEGRTRKALKIATQDYPNNLDHATEYLSKFLQSVLRTARYEKVVNFDYLFQNAVREREDFLEKNPDRRNDLAYSEEDLKWDLTEAIQDLSESKIFFQGVRPKCNRCGFRNWFTLAEIKSELVCKGCHMSFKFPAEAGWFYELNELMRRTVLNQGVMATLMCLGQILHQSRESFIYIPNICLYEGYIEDQSPNAEIDIACISDGQFIIGEVKQSAKLFTPSDFDKMEELALRLRPDKIIIYAFEGPYEHLTENIENFKKKISAHDMDIELLKPYGHIKDPSYHINPF